MKNKFYIILLLLLCQLSVSQTVTSVVDSTQIKIGSQFNLIVKAKVKPSDKVIFPSYDFVGKLEVIESYPIDTVRENEYYTLIKKYGLTQFDSGTYRIPKLHVLINKKEFFTDSSSIVVNDIKVDTLTQPMYDIKNIITVEKPSINWWNYIWFALATLLIGFITYFAIKKLSKNKKEIKELYASPVEKALAYLGFLEKKQLWQNDKVKEYYSELTDIIREYVEQNLSIPAKESTSKELIASLKKEIVKRKMIIDSSTLEAFEKVLTKADLVKFAKFKPLNFEIEQDQKNLQNFLIVLDKATPRTEEEIQNLFMEEVKRKQAKKEATQRKIIKIGLIALAVILMIVTFAFTIGYDYLKEHYFGYDTKELLEEKEWIKSSYGNPAIQVESPFALTRKIDERIQQNLAANVKSTSQFVYGEITDDFSIVLNTTALKDSTAVDKELAIENTIKKLESGGANTMIVKTEDYENTKGFVGKKAFGTFYIQNPKTKESQKMAYEIVVFVQPFGIQEFYFLYKENDEFAQKIIEKVSNSVELTKMDL